MKLKNIFFIFIGTMIFAFGLVHFNMENNLAEGGFTGITLLLYFLFDIDPSYTNILLNIPIFIIGWKALGKVTFIYTIIGTVGLSVFLWIFGRFSPISVPLHDDLTLAALFAGIFLGTGLGIIFRYGGTTGGVDIIARLVRKYRGWSMGRTMFIFDAAVITISLVYLSYKEAMYTLVAVFIGAKVIDFIQEGTYGAKGVLIISDRNLEIADVILKTLDRGVTILNGEGSYTNKERKILYCVVNRSEIVRLKQLIIAIDPHAFVTVTDVKDVLGEGFTLDENKKPLEN